MVWLASELFEEGYLELIAAETKLSEDAVLGKLARFWHITQRRGSSFTTVREISTLCRVGRVGSKWAESLINNGLLIQTTDGRLEIAGNAKRIAWLGARHNKAKKAAEARWEPLKLVKKNDASSMPQAMPQAMLMQCHDNDNDKKEISIPPCPLPGATPEFVPKATEEDRAVAVDWSEHATSVSKTVKPNIDKWAEEIRKVRDLDGVPPDEIRRMLLFVSRDQFWSKNAASPMSLRQRGKNGLLRHENIRNSMHKGSPEENKSWYDSIDLPEVKF